eukprot:1022731-Prorocentrum_minimum.AAC.1
MNLSLAWGAAKMRGNLHQATHKEGTLVFDLSRSDGEIRRFCFFWFSVISLPCTGGESALSRRTISKDLGKISKDLASSESRDTPASMPPLSCIRTN